LTRFSKGVKMSEDKQNSAKLLISNQKDKEIPLPEYSVRHGKCDFLSLIRKISISRKKKEAG